MLSTPPKLQIYMQKMCGQCRLHTYISREVQGIYIYAEKCRKVGPMQPFNEILRTVDIYLIHSRYNTAVKERDGRYLLQDRQGQ